jgi:CubicO group peptidase (beta-lactamase class C family)
MANLNPRRLATIAKWQEDLVESGKLPNVQVVVWRNGEVAFNETRGNLRKNVAAPNDAIYRFYSMTKPIVSVALMQLYEQGRFRLTDPVHLYLGDRWKKKNMKVYQSGDVKVGIETTKCEKTITIHHVLTHTSGISYGFDTAGIENKVDALYYSSGLLSRGNFNPAKERTLRDFVDLLAEQPLLFQPGMFYKYGFNTDVVARIIEVISGVSIDQYLRERIFEPCGMVDCGYSVPTIKAHRFSDLFLDKMSMARLMPSKKKIKPGNELVNVTNIDGGASLGGKFNDRPRKNRHLSGGSGLVGTALDYARFCEMLMYGGESRDGHRIISPKTLEFMTQNHLYQDGIEQDMEEMMAPGYTETTAAAGTGFGLGFSCILSASRTKNINSFGSFRWGGAASTTFFCDPEENMFCVLMTQLLLRDEHKLPLTSTLKQLAYGAIDDSIKERKLRKMTKVSPISTLGVAKL